MGKKNNIAILILVSMVLALTFCETIKAQELSPCAKDCMPVCLASDAIATIPMCVKACTSACNGNKKKNK